MEHPAINIPAAPKKQHVLSLAEEQYIRDEQYLIVAKCIDLEARRKERKAPVSWMRSEIKRLRVKTPRSKPHARKLLKFLIKLSDSNLNQWVIDMITQVLRNLVPPALLPEVAEQRAVEKMLDEAKMDIALEQFKITESYPTIPYPGAVAVDFAVTLGLREDPIEKSIYVSPEPTEGMEHE